MEKSLGNQAVKGVIWSAVERFSVQGIQFILTIIIARLVTPSEYGLIAMLSIFLSIAQVFIDSGFSNALIQKKDRNNTDFSTVFYFNIIIALLVYLCLFASSSYIASFYKEPLLKNVTRWISLNLIISAFSIIQRTKLTVALDFKTQAKSSFVSVIISGLIGIILAWKGFGVWALVCQALSNNLLNTLLLWLFAKWSPQKLFSWRSFKVLFGFGSKLLISSLLHTIYINLYSLVIGRYYSATDVGYYNRAYQFANFPSVNIVSIISRAIFPLQCKWQDNTELLNASFIKYLRISCYTIFPLMIGLAVLARPLIQLLLTEKWLFSADLLSILCIAYMFYPIMVINNQILNVKGRSDYFLKAEIIKKVVAIGILFITLPFGLYILCWGLLLYNILDVAIIIYYARKVIDTGYIQQIKNTIPSFLLSIIMGGIVLLFINTCNTNMLFQLTGGVIIGFISYIILSYLTHIKELDLILSYKKYIFN